jgi:hypothetical protein
MRKRLYIGVAVLAMAQSVAQAQPSAIDELLDAYRQQGAGEFSAARGETLWNKAVTHDQSSGQRSCATCHGSDLAKGGEHVETGKAIDPMRPAVTPDRLSDARKIEKWFLRNCKWTYGRECTPQEKGDFLQFINQ